MQGTYEKMKAFIVDGSHLVVAKSIKEALLLVVEKSILSEQGVQVIPVEGDFEELSFFRKIGDLNNLDEVKALLTFYKDETISLSYNGEYVLSQETVGGYIRSRDNTDAVLLCSKQTKFNQIIGEETWMKVDELNPVWMGEEEIEEEIEEDIQPALQYNSPFQLDSTEVEETEERPEEVTAPWPYALRRS
nr:hypothetical protein [uncultured Niameybacter sp.]